MRYRLTLLIICCVLAVILALMFPFYLNSFLASKEESGTVIHQGEDFYWSPVQLQIMFERFSDEVSRFGIGLSTVDKVKKRYFLLESREKIMRATEELGTNINTAEEYQNTMTSVEDFLKEIKPHVEGLTISVVPNILREVDKIRSKLVNLAALSRAEELKIREDRTLEVIEKRRIVYGIGITLWTLVSAFAVLLFFKIKKNKEELKRHQELLLREQEARRIAIEAQEAKNVFMASVSHEIRSPLQSILTNIEVLESELDQDTHCEKFIVRIRSSTNHLIAQINDLLDNAQISDGKLKLHMSEVDFAEIVNDVCNAHAVAIERKNIHLIIDIKNSVPIVSDGNRLRQIVWNLISNSVRYTDSGSISVGCNLEEQTDGQTYLQFSVKDTGIGIPDEFISILFHRFTQIPNRRKGGSGLGLAITKGLVDLFGGKIDVSSQLDVGTKFIVNIPVDKVTNFKDRHHISKNKILLVEDDEAVSESFAYTLRTTGYEVTQVASVKDATKMLKEISYSVVVLDMQLEDGDGLDVVEIINSGPNSKTPVIAATANSHYLKDTRANRLAMKLIKPIQQTVLKDALASVLK